MNYFTTSIAVVAGLCLGFGVLYLFIGARRPFQRSLNVLFGFFALAYAGAIMSARAAFMSESLDRFFSASRVSAIFAVVGFSLLIWFVAVYTNVRPRVLLWVLTASFALVAMAAVFLPDIVIDISGGVAPITFPWGETVLMIAAEDAAILPVYLLALFVSMGYIAVANVRLFRRGERREAIVLAVGIGWFIFTIVEESLVVVGAFDFAFLSDFGFLGFVVAMSLQMINSAIETEAELSSYKTNLESMVAERSTKLEEAHAQLLAQAHEQATTTERNRLARDLHDVITQLLFSINLVAGSLPKLWRSDPEMAGRSTDELQRLTRGALAEMRTFLRELRPNTIATTDLPLLLTHLSDGLAARHDIPASVQVAFEGSLPSDVHIGLYRIAQEAMNNVAKHANASSLTMTLMDTDDQVVLIVTDDGCGFDESVPSTTGMGLEIMRERAHEIGATLTLTSSLDVGTTVEVSWEARTMSEST